MCGGLTLLEEGVEAVVEGEARVPARKRGTCTGGIEAWRGTNGQPTFPGSALHGRRCMLQSQEQHPYQGCPVGWAQVGSKSLPPQQKLVSHYTVFPSYQNCPSRRNSASSCWLVNPRVLPCSRCTRARLRSGARLTHWPPACITAESPKPYDMYHNAELQNQAGRRASWQSQLHERHKARVPYRNSKACAVTRSSILLW